MYPYQFQYQPINQPSPQPPTQDERIWVQSEQAAESYLVAPNGFVRLWDANKPVFYEKRADATGRPLPIEAYTYSRYEEQPPEENPLIEKISMLEERISALEGKGKKKKGAEDE